MIELSFKEIFSFAIIIFIAGGGWAKIAFLSRELKETKSSLKGDYQELKSSLKDNYQELKSSLRENAQELKEFRKESAEKFQGIFLKLNSLEGRMDSLEGRMTSIEGRLKSFEDERKQRMMFMGFRERTIVERRESPNEPRQIEGASNEVEPSPKDSSKGQGSAPNID